MCKRLTYMILALMLTIALTITSMPAFAEEVVPTPGISEGVEEAEPESGLLRVYLKSLGENKLLDLTLMGNYAVENDSGFRFSSGAQIAVAVDGDNLLLQSGGLTIDMGRSLTLTRHAVKKDAKSGVYVQTSQRSNLYIGDLELTAKNGTILPVLHIDIEEYLYGVVPYEMSDSFPIEALKAQAVAARTYAMSRRASSKSRDYDVVDTTADQVFKGFDSACENTIVAVDATKGIVGRYKDNYATCYFGASNGGQTALPNHIWGYTGDYGYLDVRDDPYDLQNTKSPVKSMDVPASGGKIPSELKTLLKAGLTEQMAASGLSDELQDIQIDRILDIEPIDPRFDDGARLYDTLRFTLRVKARAWEEIEVTIEPDPTPTPLPLDAAVNDDESMEEVSSTPTDAPINDDETMAEVDSTPAPTSEFAESAPTPEPGSTPQPQTRIEWVLGESEPLDQLFTVDLPVFEQFKKKFGMKISVADCELVSIVKKYPEPSLSDDEDTQTDIDEQTAEPTGFVIEMRRFGHGVGLSQRGAQNMAGQHGFMWQEILDFYYPYMDVVDMQYQIPQLTNLAELPTVFGRSRPQPTPKPTPKPLPPLQDGEQYATVALSSDSSSLNVREAPSVDGRILDVLAHKQRVIIMDVTEDGWAHIKTAELAGYVSMAYLKQE